jgi:hypothetical protein
VNNFTVPTKLRPGRYRVSIVATDPTGNASPAQPASFKVPGR